jgi:hypothetical protein
MIWLNSATIFLNYPTTFTGIFLALFGRMIQRQGPVFSSLDHLSVMKSSVVKKSGIKPIGVHERDTGATRFGGHIGGLCLASD